jgi:hypothetical protein
MHTVWPKKGPLTVNSSEYKRNSCYVVWNTPTHAPILYCVRSDSLYREIFSVLNVTDAQFYISITRSLKVSNDAKD